MNPRGRTPPYIEHLFSIKIDNLPYRSRMSDVEDNFKKFGKVGDIYIPRDNRTHESRGFAFVRYYDERDAEDAIMEMDGRVMDGREIRVAMARNSRPATAQNDSRRSGNSRYREGQDYRKRGRDSYRERRRSPRRRSRSRSYSRSPRYHRRSTSRSPIRFSRSPVSRYRYDRAF